MVAYVRRLLPLTWYGVETSMGQPRSQSLFDALSLDCGPWHPAAVIAE